MHDNQTPTVISGNKIKKGKVVSVSYNNPSIKNVLLASTITPCSLRNGRLEKQVT